MICSSINVNDDGGSNKYNFWHTRDSHEVCIETMAVEKINEAGGKNVDNRSEDEVHAC